MILTAVAGVLAVAMLTSPAYAQRGGRGGGGGGRGWSGGGGGRGWNGGGWGGRGWDGGGYYGGYGRGYYGGYGRGFYGLGLGYGGYGWDGYSPGYYGTPDNYAFGTYSDYQPYYYTQPMISTNTGLSNYQVQAPTGTSYASQSFYSAPSTAGSAELTVKVPANAQLWLGTMQSGQTGTDRHFTFPALPAGDNYFTLRSTWNDNGKMVTRDRQVNMKAGANSTVDLTQATDNNATPSTSDPNVNHPAPPKANIPAPLNTDDGKSKTPPIRPNTGVPK
jgi:uncharacterized protein (TIGR03000 family)